MTEVRGEGRGPVSETRELQLGESRIVSEEPCPDDYMHHDHGYWKLRRVSSLLIDEYRGKVWNDPTVLLELHSIISLLRQCADQTPMKPMAVWEDAKLGVTYEIKCPNCATVFQWKGKFYAPRCPECKQWLRERSKGAA